MRRHAIAKRGHLLRKLFARLRDQLVSPLREHANGVRVKMLDLLGGELAGQQHRRQLGRVQDLVGVGIADAAQQVRIGKARLSV